MADDVERLAELLSWTSGEMTRWSKTAHPDHNRWSWRGDGHGEAIRDQFRGQASALLARGVTLGETPGALHGGITADIPGGGER